MTDSLSNPEPTRARLRLFVWLSGFMALLLWMPLVHAATFTFDGGAGTSTWFEPENWSPTGIPGAGDTASITNSSVNLSGNATVAGLVLAGTSQLSGSTLTVNNTFNWTGGTVINTINVPSGAQQNISGIADKSLSGIINNAGTATVSGVGRLVIAPGASTALNNTGTMLLMGDNVLDSSSPINGLATLNNSGTLTKGSGTGTGALANVNLNNTGTVNVNSGSLAVSGQVTSSSTFNVATGSWLHIVSGTCTFNNGTTFAGGGVTRLTNVGGSTVTMNGSATVTGTFEIASYVLSPSDVGFNGSGQVAWTDGTIDGTVRIAAGTQLNITGSADKSLGGTVSNAGNAVWSGSGAILPRGTFNNSGSFVAQNDGTFGAFNASGTVNNSGTFTKAGGTGVTRIGGDQSPVTFNNSGVVNANTGTLQVMGHASVSPGNFNAAAGAAIVFAADHTFGGTLASAPGGTIDFGGGLSGPQYNFNVGATFASGGQYRVVDVVKFSGSPTVNGTLELADGQLNGGTVNVSGSGEVAWTGTTISSLSTVNVAPNMQFNIRGSGAKNLSGGVINNAGAATWTGEGPITIHLDSAFNNSGSFTALNDGKLIPASSNGNAIFNNLPGATFTKAGGSGSTSFEPGGNAGVTFNNAGTVNVAVGTLEMSGGGTASGAFNTAAGARLDFDAGNFAFTAGTTFNGTGVSRVTGQVNLTGTATLNNAFELVDNAYILIDSNVSFAGGGQFNWVDGKIDGTINITSGTQFNLTGSGNRYLSGTINAAGQTVNNSGGNLGGFGVLSGNVINSAQISPGGSTDAVAAGSVARVNRARLWNGAVSVGTGGSLNLEGNKPYAITTGIPTGILTINGNTTQTSTGVLNIQLGGALSGQFDQLKVSNTAVLGGTLNVSLINNFSPPLGTTFQIISYTSHSGNFGTIMGLDLGNGLILQPEVRPNGVFLTVVRKGQNVTGRVVSPAGVAVAGISVTRRVSGTTTIVQTVTTDSRGQYSFSGVPAGNHILACTRTGFGFNPPTNTVAVKTADMTGINFMALQTPYISGRMTNAAGVPLAGANVSRRLASASTGTPVVATTNTDGYYGFSRVMAGSYTLTPSKTGQAFTPVTRTVSVTATTSVNTANFTGRPTIFALSGTVTKGTAPILGVTGPASSPVPAVPVYLVKQPNLSALAAVLITPPLFSSSSSFMTRTTTNTSGQYSFMAAGAYYIVPTRPGTLLTPAYRGPLTVTSAALLNQNFSGVSLDATAPTVTVSSATSTQVSGVATDSGSTASGILTVVATLQNGSNQYINWLATGSTPQFTAAPGINSYKIIGSTATSGPLFNLNKVNTQNWTVLLPGTLAAGNYRLTLRAIDRSFRISPPVTRTIVKASAVKAMQTKAVPPSSASAKAATGQVSLRFQKALDADSASDPERYTISINGHDVAVESAGYNANSHTVVLSLPEGALEPGDSVVVRWKGLLDAAGAEFSGQSGPLLAQ